MGERKLTNGHWSFASEYNFSWQNQRQHLGILLTNGPEPKRKSRSMTDVKMYMLSEAHNYNPGTTEGVGWGGGILYKDCWRVYSDVWSCHELPQTYATLHTQPSRTSTSWALRCPSPQSQWTPPPMIWLLTLLNLKLIIENKRTRLGK